MFPINFFKLKLFIILIYLLISSNLIYSQPYFQFIENGKIGYIDVNGNVAIKPIFNGAGDFSEGLAAVRINGKYGYIDTTGKFVIPQQFDYAMPFHEGFAVVYNDSNSGLIDKFGKIQFLSKYKAISSVKNGNSLVLTHSNNFGLIDVNGKLLTDTVFVYTYDFNEGLAIVAKRNFKSLFDENLNVIEGEGVIDTLGNYIVPIGKYNSYSSFSNGFACVSLPGTAIRDNAYNNFGFINRSGELKFVLKPEYRFTEKHDFYNGLLPIHILKSIKYSDSYFFNKEQYYFGFLDTIGILAISDTNYLKGYPLTDKMLFVITKDDRYLVLDYKGNILKELNFILTPVLPFDESLYSAYSDVRLLKYLSGYTLAKINDNCRIIDSNFDIVSDIIINENFSRFYWNQGIAFYHRGQKTGGVCDFKGNNILDSKFTPFGTPKYNLIKIIIDSLHAYLNLEGKIIWKEKRYRTVEPDTLDIDYMYDAYSHYHSKTIYSPYSYLPNDSVDRRYSLKNSDENYSKGKISILAMPNNKALIGIKYAGFKVYVLNDSDKDMKLDRTDRLLNMKIQALDSKGNWKDLEYLYHNFYATDADIFSHPYYLGKGCYWEFNFPLFKTITGIFSFIQVCSPSKSTPSAAPAR